MSYSMLGQVEATGGYSSHPWHAQDPEFLNHTRVSGGGGWTLALTFKRRFGK